MADFEKDKISMREAAVLRNCKEVKRIEGSLVKIEEGDKVDIEVIDWYPTVRWGPLPKFVVKIPKQYKVIRIENSNDFFVVAGDKVIYVSPGDARYPTSVTIYQKP